MFLFKYIFFIDIPKDFSHGKEIPVTQNRGMFIFNVNLYLYHSL